MSNTQILHANYNLQRGKKPCNLCYISIGASIFYVFCVHNKHEGGKISRGTALHFRKLDWAIKKCSQTFSWPWFPVRQRWWNEYICTTCWWQMQFEYLWSSHTVCVGPLISSYAHHSHTVDCALMTFYCTPWRLYTMQIAAIKREWKFWIKCNKI